jgi:hypothetical protein
VPSHYEILGVARTASHDEVRQAYLVRARAVHPDRALDASSAEASARARAMQDVNEAWRVLRDTTSRMVYNRALAVPRHEPEEPTTPRVEPSDLDVPYTSAVAEPGDLGVAVVRALPWLAIAAILVSIFVFTAFAGRSGEPPGPRSLVGKCISSGAASAVVPVPCGEPNEGRVELVVDRASFCPTGSTSRPVPGDLWLCLRPAGPSASTGAP